MKNKILFAAFAVLAAAAVGCGGESTSAAEPATNGGGESAPSVSVASIDGPGGTVSIGDDYAAFDEAFPRPPEATDAEEAPEVEGFENSAWQVGEEGSPPTWQAGYFSKDGKIASVMHMKAGVDEARKATLMSGLGDPTEMAETKQTDLYAWQDGDNWHVLLIGKGTSQNTMEAIGTSEVFTAMGFDVKQMVEIIKAMDEMPGLPETLDESSGDGE